MRKNKVAKNVKEFLLDLIFMTAGSVIYAVGLNGFTAPNNIAPGGVSGIAIVLNYLFGTPVGTVILLINVPIIIWAIIEIGYKLVTKTMLAVVLNAACIDIVALFMPVYHGDPLIITLIGGVCEGVGLSLVFMRGATTGGTDMIARLLNHRLRHLSMGKLMLAVDGCVVLFSAIVYKSIESAVYACIDAGNGKMFFIMSHKNDVIADRIIKEMDRGLTFLKSRSGYLKQDGEVLFCAVRRFEVFRISEIIREEDPDAFVIVGDAGEIAGEGFKPVRSDDRTLGEIIKAIRKTGDEPVSEPKE